jgi:hypothetical protein
MMMEKVNINMKEENIIGQKDNRQIAGFIEKIKDVYQKSRSKVEKKNN